MTSLTLLTRIMVSSIVGIVFGILWRFASRPRRIWTLLVVSVVAGIVSFGGTLGLKLIPSRPVGITIESPPSRTEVEGATAIITGTVSPADARVMIFVHSWDDWRWWVQETPTIVSVDQENDSAVWQAQIYLGTEESGAGEFFEIVALGSQDPLLFDVLTERYFQKADELTNLPTLSQSNSLILLRSR